MPELNRAARRAQKHGRPTPDQGCRTTAKIVTTVPSTRSYAFRRR